MDIEKVLKASKDYLQAWEVLKQAELEADALRNAAWDFYSALNARMSPEELERRWKVLVRAAEKVLGKEVR
jgi:hypothetical protein